MSFACPHRHQSYVSFRNEVFRSLFCSLPAQAGFPLRIRLHQDSLLSRSFQNSVKARKQSRPRDIKPESPRGAKRSTSVIESDELEQKSLTDGEGLGASANARRGKPAIWTPFSSKGRDDLRALLSELKTAASEFKPNEKEDKLESTAGIENSKYIDRNAVFSKDNMVARTRRISLDLPESPLMRRLRKKEIHKREPTDEEYAVLSQNPWAVLLSSPIRQCQGTGVRLPRDLMIPWGLTKRASDGQTYVVPRELADVKRFKNPDAAVWRPANDTATEEETRHSSPRSLDDSSGRFKRTSAINIIPFQPLTELLTSNIIRNSANNPTAKKGAVQRILPLRLKTSLLKEKHYAQKGDQVIDLPSLQWQPDIAERMLDIMRQRVLNTLTALGSTCPQRGTIDPVPLEVLETGRMVAVYDSADSRQWLRYRLEVGTGPRVADPVIMDNFAGSFLIHINGTRQPIPYQPSTPLASDTNLLLPTISLNETIRLPVFNLLEMMGNDDKTLRRYEEAIQSCEVLGPPKPMEWETQPLTRDRGPGLAPSYLLFATAKAPKARSLAMELWQLWRYQGGQTEELEVE